MRSETDIELRELNKSNYWDMIKLKLEFKSSIQGI